MKLDWIQNELRARVCEFTKTFIILDALDECSVTGGTVRQSLDFLFGLQQKANINILASSRFNEEYANLFMRTGAILAIQASEDDIRAYIDHRAAYFSPFVAKKNGLLTYIRDEITKASRGMFLLAKLYLNLVQDGINEKRIRKVIERFQPGSGAYDDAYDETMKRIEQQGKYAEEIAKTIFGWVLLSTRPLSLPEIQHALAVEIDEPEFDDTSIIDVEELLSICIGLITIDADSNSLSKYPFYKYSAQNWGHHYKRHAGEESMTMGLLTTENKVHASSQVIFRSISDRTTQVERDERSPKRMRIQFTESIKIKEPLEGAHLAAFLGLLSPLVSMLDFNMIEVDIEDHVGRTPLSWAVAYGHEEISNMLLQKGANPDSMNHFGFTPLFYAAVSGKVGIMQSLMKAGAQVNRLDRNGRTPLFHAAGGDPLHLNSSAFEGDCLASLELLLAHGASATQVDNIGQTPLFIAATNGRDSVVKLLIERDAHIYYTKSPDLGKLDPLATAAMNGHSTTAKLLFDAGAYTISARDGEAALSAVMLANLLKSGSKGRDDVFRDLIAQGVDPNVRDSYQRLALHFAALYGDENLLKCLLANGADLNAKDVFGRTPIFYAIFGNKHATVSFLLDYPGINWQITDIFGDTPLMQSYTRRHKGNQWSLFTISGKRHYLRLVMRAVNTTPVPFLR
ncbi:hypothetical protein N7493_009561 [Penicillium malachiteum]|uniref:GPI inositol-deacylase winged helix domain-containing protein n=1 Tax=Penicillium malachiteum TaxID=1324776 RepID=A0AAD6HEB5_9EURO|nr:hypothetical protein N7493_009561 [Penicillium malachiteum]